jgi:hypothetical protein
MEKDTLKTGDKVNWLYEGRGGYGYVRSIAGVVIRIAPKKVQIRVARRHGDKWVGVSRWVEHERLSRRLSRAGDAERVIECWQEQEAVKQGP